MKKGYGQGDAGLASYVESLLQPEDEVLVEIRARATAAGLPEIQVGPLDGLLLELLARLSGARKAVEIGTLGGYSGVCLLRGMPGGHLDTFELSAPHAAVARESFQRAGFGPQATIHVGPALDRLPAIEERAPFDLVFIDADKTSYPAYREWAATHLRVGGLLLADNTFAWGEVATSLEPGPAALRAYNAAQAKDGRFRTTIVPTAEGLTLGLKLRD